MDQQQLNRLMMGDYANRERPAIYPEKFYIEYRDNPADPLKPREIEMVKWVKRGAPGSGGVMPITKVQKDPLWWDVIGPFYDAWKKGLEVPESGTPLGAWPACRPEEKERFNLIRIYTVEDVANMTDNDCDRFGMGARAKRDLAKSFLKAGNQTQAALEIEGLKSELQASKDALDEALQSIAFLKSKLPQDVQNEMNRNLENPAPRRGRPPKDKAA